MFWTILFLIVLALLGILVIANIVITIINKKKLKKGEAKR